MQFKGLDEYEKQLLRIQKASGECIGRAIYDGAGIIADEVKQGIEAIPIDTRIIAKKGQKLEGITAKQKQGLRDGFGIARMQNENGYVHVKIGFHGYNEVYTNQYPGGQPNSVIARSVNSGTSFRQRIPFVDTAVNAKKAACENKMKETFDKVLKENL